MMKHVGLSLVLGCVLITMFFPIKALAEEPPTALDQPVALRALLEQTKHDPALVNDRMALVTRAETAVKSGIIRRAEDPVQMQAMRIKEVGRAALMTDPERRRLYALAMFDSNAGAVLYQELPTVAAAYALTGDSRFRDHVLAQLNELAGWVPLQRPGWTLGSTKADLPPAGDGVWLATGWLIRAVADSLEYLPTGTIDQDLQGRLDGMLDGEIVRIASDWENQVPWYVRANKRNSNQWVVPAEGLIRACLLRGVDRHRDAYEQGVAAMLQSFEAQGSKGEFTEGLTYGSITVRSMISAARAMAEIGDDRLMSHPFLRNTGTWFVHHIQPGGFLVNAFDTLNGARGQLSIFGNVFAQVAVSTGNPDVLWALNRWALSGNSVDYLLARSLPAVDLQPPPLWAYYPVGTRTVWRSSWDDETASGVWLRGGGASDFHDHADRGHVNFIIGRKALLIEAGTPPYGTPESALLYTGQAGHNVLQIGREPHARTSADTQLAPMTVNRLDENGGDVTIDATACYPQARRWIRRVTWDRTEMRVHDDVELLQPDIVIFRWHTGEPADATVVCQPGVIDVGEVRFEYEADAPLNLVVADMPDATMKIKTLGRHACLVTETVEPVRNLSLQTVINLSSVVKQAE